MLLCCMRCVGRVLSRAPMITSTTLTAPQTGEKRGAVRASPRSRLFSQQPQYPGDIPVVERKASAVPPVSQSAAEVCERMSQLLKAGDIEGVIMTYK